MPRKKANSTESDLPPMRPALSPEARENQLISLAYDQVEKQLREGTASSQVLSILLKRGSPREHIEQELLEKQRDLAAAKAEAIKAEKRADELYLDAMKAMAIYAGEAEEDDYD